MGVLRSAAHRRAESRFWGVFIIAVHRAFVLGLGARHRGIVELSEGVIRCVTVFACYSSSSLREREREREAPRLRCTQECRVCVVALVRGEVCAGTLARRTPPNWDGTFGFEPH